MKKDELHPLIREMFDLLPPTDSVWPAIDRLKWLCTMVLIFDLVYGPISGTEIQISDAGAKSGESIQ